MEVKATSSSIEPQHGEVVASKRSKPPSTIPGAVAVKRKSKTSKIDRFLVDNTMLKARTAGISFRTCKDLSAKDTECAEWGSVIEGFDEGNGWLRIGSRFMPMIVQDLPVLTLFKPTINGEHVDKRQGSKSSATAQLPSAKRTRSAPKQSGGEWFRNLHGEVVLVDTTAVTKKQVKKFADLEPSEVDSLSAEEISFYEKELQLPSRRSLLERITRIEQVSQRNTLKGGASAITFEESLELMTQLNERKADGKDLGPRFLQAFLALPPEDRRMAAGIEVAQLEKLVMLKDADSYTIAERRSRLKLKVWEARTSVASATRGHMSGQGFWKALGQKAAADTSGSEVSGKSKDDAEPPEASDEKDVADVPLADGSSTEAQSHTGQTK